VIDERLHRRDDAFVTGDVSIGEHSSLWPLVVARGDVNRIVIGAPKASFVTMRGGS
jgi:carbonic anhydrase/acetyltransferase-like protein (isoleucine patch superfamily)